MSEHIESVNVAVRIFRNHAEGTEDNSKRANSTRLVERLEAASAELVRLYGLTSALPPDLGNVFDLPPELLEELSITKADELEDQLVTVINTYGGTASLDMILVGLYRKFGVTQKRRLIQNKLYRMAMVWSTPGKKGVYTTEQPKETTDTDPGGDGVLAEPVEDIIGYASESVEEKEEEDIPI